MNKTFIPSFDYNTRKWYVIDCKDRKLGRIASSITKLLIGKTKPYYHSAIDVGDYVILINIQSLIINNNVEHLRVFRPGRPGSSLKRIINNRSQQVIEKSIFGMMKKGIVKRNLSKRLKMYHGDILTWPRSWMVFIFVLNFGTHGGSITGNDSIPSFGLGRVNSICDGATFIDICPFSSSLCHTC